MNGNVEDWVRERIAEAEAGDGLRFESEEELERYVRAMESNYHHFRDGQRNRERRPWSAP